MAYKKFPPKGYRSTEFPLPHDYEYQFELSAEGTTLDSTVITLLRADELNTAPETVETNPSNSGFGEETGATIHMGSIVPRIRLSIKASLTKGAIETDKVQSLLFNMFPIYSSFLDSLTAEDSKTATNVQTLLELQHDTTNKDVYPTNSGTDLVNSGNQPLNTRSRTEVFGDYGLTTDAKLESTTFAKNGLFDGKDYYSNAGMLRKVQPYMMTGVVTQHRPYFYNSNKFTYPSVKRGNPYTYCGILFHLPQTSQVDQYGAIGDTTAISHIRFKVKVRFDEWNPLFDQTAF